jgi:hypothetical protein
MLGIVEGNAMTTANARLSVLTRHDRDKLKAAISAAPVRPFLVTLDQSCGSGAELNIHAAREAVSRAVNTSPHRMGRDISRQISGLGLDVCVKVKFYGRNALDKSRSLEQFFVKFERGERIYDPTGVFDEAERLVNFARGLRRQLAEGLKGLYWSSRWRTTYVVLNEEAFVEGYCLSREKLAAAERTVVDAYEASAGQRRVDSVDGVPNDSLNRFEAAASHNVRLCFNTPAMPVVPIDEASIPYKRASWEIIPRVLRLLDLRTLSRVPLLTVLFGMGSAGMALAKVPGLESPLTQQAGVDATKSIVAVSASDAKGSVEDPLNGAASLPSDVGDLFPGGPGLHLLWRDPVHGAVGQGLASQRAPAGTQISQPQTNPLVGSDRLIGRDQFHEVAKSGATFCGPAGTADEGKLDLKWVADGEARHTGGSGRPGSSASPMLQPGIAALLGLSKLTRSDPTDQAYATVLEDLRFHFGFARSLQVEAHSSALLHQNLDSSDQEALTADNQMEARKRPRGSSA